MADAGSYTVTLPGPPGYPVGVAIADLASYTSDLDSENAALLDIPRTKHLIDKTLGRALQDQDKPKPKDKDFVCLIHVLRWKWDPDKSTTGRRSVDKQTWWVYSNEGSRFDKGGKLIHDGTWALENFAGTRIMGARKFIFSTYT
jgi:hypothetical protein